MGMGCSDLRSISDTDDTEEDTAYRSKRLEPDRTVLLLGAGDSGKSTIFKQLQHMYTKSFQRTEERMQFKAFIVDNVLTAIQILVKASFIYDPIVDANNRETARKITELEESILEKTDTQGWECLPMDPMDLYTLWLDEGIQKTYEKRSMFHLDDNAPYFLSKMAELTRKNYVPSFEDILRSRKKTVGVADQIFEIRGKKLKVVDVGGQKNERRKWINFFANVDAVVYVSSLSEYDQLTYENNTTPRLIDSINVFKTFYETKDMSAVPVYLVLNKLDVMTEKCQTGQRKMSQFHRDFTGNDSSVEDYKQFIKNKILEEDRDNRVREVFYSNAVDEQSIRLLVENILGGVL